MDSLPPEQTSHALTSDLEGHDHVLGLKLPMPFLQAAEISFHSRNSAKISFELRLTGEETVPLGRFGKLHVQPRERRGPTLRTDHLVATATGRENWSAGAASSKATPIRTLAISTII